MGPAIAARTLILAIAAVVAVETLAIAAASNADFSPVLITGVARLADIALLCVILLRSKEGMKGAGLAFGEVWAGVKKGLLWSLSFAAAAGLLFGLIYASGFDATSFLKIQMPGSRAGIIQIMVVGGIAAPVAEEIFFRGILFGFFRRWGFPVALALSTLLFVAAHPLSLSFPFTQIVGGIVFAAAYEREKNLIIPVTIHSLGNVSLFALPFLKHLM
ncbi:MAG: CPBP family intramembrane metalloprotease [Syntrophales bacterium]|jgi:membrane protease YdiL (CAAX protease family)|nr:CPBP family intramembrane metalloprotease [Syntrophales bacterium]